MLVEVLEEHSKKLSAALFNVIEVKMIAPLEKRIAELEANQEKLEAELKKYRDYHGGYEPGMAGK